VHDPRRKAGVTLIEVAVVIALIGALMVISFSSLRDWQQNERTTAAARGAADLLRLAASDALRTGNIHIVFLSVAGSGDVAGGNLTDPDGDWVPMLVLDDGAPGSAGQNCRIDAGEPTRVLEAVPGLSWGNALAGGTKAPGDSTAIVSTSGASFATPAGTGTTWVAFMPDGRPVGMDAACNFGQLGSGNGGIYVTNGSRDYAVVLNALGGVRVHAWNEAAGAWQG
jgi:prepilin-type N-terminal cleavage/methylation domain-containing protein